MLDNTEATIPIPTNEDERYFLESYIQELRQFIVDIAFTHGRACKELGCGPWYDLLAVRWHDVYSCLDVYVYDKSILNLSCNLRVFGQNERLNFSPGFDVSLAVFTDDLLSSFFKGIKIEASVRECAVPVPHAFGSARRICQQMGGKWLCEDCIDRYTLPARIVMPKTERLKTAVEIERAKLNTSLRFEILERDRFTCRLCGRSPYSGDGVKLHVDHIIPVARGGKTERNNLHVLCRDCNLGKRDRMVEQLIIDLAC
jgi:5-methylcytosine-specific restriction endonuclease McrA